MKVSEDCLTNLVVVLRMFMRQLGLRRHESWQHIDHIRLQLPKCS